jgi:integrase
MASLTRKDRSPYWFACFTKPDGTRTKISTKQSDKRKAMGIAVEWERASLKAQQGLLTEAQARSTISSIVEIAVGEPLDFHTVEEWLKHWLAVKKDAKAEGTYERYQHVIGEFTEYLGKRAKLNLVQVTPKDVRTFRDAQLAQGKSAKTCNLAVKTISAALNAARRQGFITSNPADAVEPLPHQSDEKGIFTQEQVTALLKAAPTTDWKGAILLGYYTAVRLSDIANLTWGAIDLPSKLLRFIPQKTRGNGKFLTIPIHRQLDSWLIDLPAADTPQAFIFPSLAGRKTGGAHGLSRKFADIMETAGISAGVARPRKDEGKGRAVSKLSFHSLRHSCNSILANRGVAQEIRQKLTGHSSADVNKVYTHHELDPLRAAIALIPRIDLD